MAANKKHYMAEVIELQNGDQIWARNLPIKQLKIFHKELQKWTDFLSDTQDALKQLEVEAAEIADKDDRNYDDVLAELQKKYDRDHRDDMTFIDVSANCALIALSTWTVRNEKSQTIDPEKIDLEYIEENVDMTSLNRIMEIAGAMELGDVGPEGKAKA